MFLLILMFLIFTLPVDIFMLLALCFIGYCIIKLAFFKDGCGSNKKDDNPEFDYFDIWQDNQGL